MTDQAKVNALEAQLGFNLMAGGRRFGEMKLTPMDSGKVYLEMPGSLVTVHQTRMISRILNEATPDSSMVLIDSTGERITGVEPLGIVEGMDKPRQRRKR
jgi:hypothetical protein